MLALLIADTLLTGFVCVCVSDAASAEVKFTPGMKQNKFEMLMTKEEMEEEQR